MINNNKFEKLTGAYMKYEYYNVLKILVLPYIDVAP